MMCSQVLLVLMCVLNADVPDQAQLEEIVARVAGFPEQSYESSARANLRRYMGAWASDPSPERAAVCEFLIDAFFDSAPRPLGPGFYYHAARILDFIGNEERAIGLLRELIEQHGEKRSVVPGAHAEAVSANLYLGRMLTDAGRFDEAIDAYEQAVSAINRRERLGNIRAAWCYLKIAEVQAVHMQDSSAALETIAQLQDVVRVGEAASFPPVPAAWAQRIAEEMDQGASAIVCPPNHPRILVGAIAHFLESKARETGISVELSPGSGESTSQGHLCDMALGKIMSTTRSGIDRELAAWTRARCKARHKHWDCAESAFRALFESSAFLAPQAGLELAACLAAQERDQEAARVLEAVETRWPSYAGDAMMACQRYHVHLPRQQGDEPPSPAAEPPPADRRPQEHRQEQTPDAVEQGQMPEELTGVTAGSARE